VILSESRAIGLEEGRIDALSGLSVKALFGGLFDIPIVALQPDGSFASLPAWMTEAVASRFEIGGEPHFPLHILRSMRAEVDALLGFLLSESKMETAHNGAQIRTSPTKPVRRGDAAREAVPSSQASSRGSWKLCSARSQRRWST
jgi:hypothetical protein